MVYSCMKTFWRALMLMTLLAVPFAKAVELVGVQSLDWWYRRAKAIAVADRRLDVIQAGFTDTKTARIAAPCQKTLVR